MGLIKARTRRVSGSMSTTVSKLALADPIFYACGRSVVAKGTYVYYIKPN